MSNVVDDRVVKMKFDNEQFEDGVKDTMRSLDDLDKDLKNLDKSNFGSGLEGALSGIGGAVDDLADRFDGWGIFVKRIIENVADFAYEQGLKMVKSLSTDNIMAGWQKYEDLSSNIYAIANQVSNGETYEDVTRAIEKLSWYSDATSFSLSDMTSALKGFVSQGIDLNTATAMIMGMGNSITYAGAGAKEGSGAFQVFAKAMGQGYIGLRQWQQMSTTYGIATYGLKQQALDAAVALNKLTVSYDEAGEAIYETDQGLKFTLEEFDTTLGNQKGKWLDKDVMQALYGDTGAYGDYISGLAEYIQEVKETTGRQLTWNEAVEEYGEFLGRDLTEQEEFSKMAAESASVAKTLTEAIDAVKDAVSTSWQRIFQSMFGDVEKAKEVWSEFSDFLNEIFGSPMATLANYMEAWSKLPLEMGGRDSFLNIFRNLSTAVRSYLNPITKAWEVIHGSKTFNDIVKKIGETVKAVENFTKKLQLSEETSAKFQRVWEVIFEVLKTAHEGLKKIWGLFSAVGTVVTPVIKLLGGVALAIAEVVDVIFKVFNLEGNLWNWLVGPTNAIKAFGAKLSDTLAIFEIAKGPVTEGVKTAFEDVSNAASGLGNTIENATTSLSSLWEEFKKTEGYQKFISNLDEVKAKIKEWNSNFLTEFAKSYHEHGGGVVGTVTAAYEGVKSALSNLYDSLLIILDGHFGGAMEKIRKFASWVETTVSNTAKNVKEFAGKAFAFLTTGVEFDGGIFGHLGDDKKKAKEEMSLIDQMRANIDKEVKSAQNAGTVMTTVFGVASGASVFDLFRRLDQIVKNIAETFKSAKGTFESISNYFDSLTKSLKLMQTEVKADIIKDIAIAVGALAASMFVLAQIPSEDLANALGVITVLIGEMGAMAYAMSKIDFTGTKTSWNNAGTGFEILGSGMKDSAKQIIGMAASVLLLAEAMKKIAEIPVDQMHSALEAITLLIIELGAFAKLTATKEGTIGGLSGNTGTQIFKMASGLVVMAQALKMLAELDNKNGDLKKGLDAVSAILFIIGVYQTAMSAFGEGGLEQSGNIIALAAGLAALALVVKIFANIPTDQLQTGGIAIGVALTAVAAFMGVMSDIGSKGADFVKISASLVIFAAALGILAGALLVMNLVQPASLLEAGAAIAAFIASVYLIDKLHLDKTMISFGVALAAFGIGVAGIGVGLLAFATAMTIISVQAPVFAAGLIEILGVLLVGIVALKPKFVAAVISIIEGLCEALVGSIDTILQTLKYVFLAVIESFFSFLVELGNTIEKYWPTIKEHALKLFGALKEAVITLTPKILLAFLNLLKNIGTYIVNHWPEIKEKAATMMSNIKEAVVEGAAIILARFGLFLLDIGNSIRDKYNDIKARAGELIDNFKAGLSERFDEAVKTVTDFVQSIIDGIAGFALNIWETGKNLIDSFLGGIFSKDEDVSTAGGHTATTYKDGIESGKNEVQTAGANLGTAAATGAGSVNLYSAGANMVYGLIDGINDKIANRKLEEATATMAGKVDKITKRTMHEKSPSEDGYESGAYYTEGVALGVADDKAVRKVVINSKKTAEAVTTTVTNTLGDDAVKGDVDMIAHGLGTGAIINTVDGLKEAKPELFTEIDDIVSQVADKVDTEMDLNPVITPTVDLTEFDAKTEEMQTKLNELKRQTEYYTMSEDSRLKASELEKAGDLAGAVAEIQKGINDGPVEKSFTQWWTEYKQGLRNPDMKYLSQHIEDVPQVTILGGNTLDLIHAAAAGMLSKSDMKKYEKELKEYSGTINYIINQTIKTPTPAQPIDVYRATNNALAKTKEDNYITGSGAGSARLNLATSV